MSRAESYVLALAPISQGMGVFVVETSGFPVDWRVREARSEHKNAQCLLIADELLGAYRPVALVIEDHRAPGARRGARVGELLDLLAELGTERAIAVARYGFNEVRTALGLSPRANKDGIAAAVAQRLPALAPRLPKPKRFWEPEAHAMAVFSAAALALTHLRAQSVPA
ncbi:MAG: hypothetical protein HXY28_05815 [Hydrogenophilaceae bacterium]|nr:hypothetical protein [Hydrogenophilaceae bacterium]